MQYNRVIPRDFFNEAKLLKCMGQLSLKILDRKVPRGLIIQMPESGERFEILLMEEGSLYVSNYPVFINQHMVRFKTTYNSKLNYPLLCEINSVDLQVFDENGEFELEFVNAVIEELQLIDK